MVLPVGVRTKLGWTVIGRVTGYYKDSESVFHSHVSSPDDELHSMVKSWWKTESFGFKCDVTTKRSMEDERVMEFLDETTRRVDKRYEVGLIWKSPETVLPNNKVVAEKRLCMLERRLQKDTELSTEYSQTIENDEKKGYIKRLSEEEIWYQ